MQIIFFVVLGICIETPNTIPKKNYFCVVLTLFWQVGSFYVPIILRVNLEDAKLLAGGTLHETFLKFLSFYPKDLFFIPRETLSISKNIPTRTRYILEIAYLLPGGTLFESNFFLEFQRFHLKQLK